MANTASAQITLKCNADNQRETETNKIMFALTQRVFLLRTQYVN